MCVCVRNGGLFGLAAASLCSMTAKQDGKADLATTRAECAPADSAAEGLSNLPAVIECN